MITNMREKILLRMVYSVVAMILIISLSILSANIVASYEAISESKIVLKLAKECGDREWIVYWTYSPGKSRNLKCWNRRGK